MDNICTSIMLSVAPTQTALALLALFALTADAQGSTNATCLPAYSWMSNSLGQSPCLVSAWVTSVCNGPWVVGPINGPSSTYQPPGSDEATNCRCSTVQYQLISACTICQGGLNASTWSTWTENCPQSLITKGFPRAVPTNTTIPSWAYLDPTISGIFDVNAALAANNLPIFPPATPSPAAASSFPAPPPPEDNDSRPRIHPAAAIGGALGGTLGIVGLAASAYFFMRHRSQRGKFRSAGPYNASSAAFSAHSGVPLAGVYPGPHFPGHGLASDPQLVNDSMMEFQLPSQHSRGRALGTLEYLPGSNPDRIAPGFTGRPEL